MFIGHFGLGLAAKGTNKRPLLGTYFLAVQFLDLLWSMFLIRDIEKVQIEPGNTVFTPLNFVYYPYSHSLVGAVFWSLLFAAVYYFFQKDKRSALLLGALVFSHWALDFVTHRPDLPLSPWTTEKFGLGLWNYRIVTIIIESIIFLTGIFVFLRNNAFKNMAGHVAFWSFIIFMFAVYFMNAYGPPPNSIHSIAVISVSQWILIGWGYWIDANTLNMSDDAVVSSHRRRSA